MRSFCCNGTKIEAPEKTWLAALEQVIQPAPMALGSKLQNYAPKIPSASQWSYGPVHLSTRIHVPLQVETPESAAFLTSLLRLGKSSGADNQRAWDQREASGSLHLLLLVWFFFFGYRWIEGACWGLNITKHWQLMEGSLLGSPQPGCRPSSQRCS